MVPFVIWLKRRRTEHRGVEAGKFGERVVEREDFGRADKGKVTTARWKKSMGLSETNGPREFRDMRTEGRTSRSP